tara:strand:+ start:432 stop:1070 length:639 start_codon:yes stop_codon:yes gene_type:complete
MIYDAIDIDCDISQGDIFTNIPRIDISFSDLVVTQDDGDYNTNWEDAILSTPDQEITAILAIKPVTAVVITQDCDATREDFISLCVVDDYLKTIGQDGEPSSSLKWAGMISKKSRENAKVFYLPPDESIGLSGPKGVCFLDVLRVPLWDLKKHRTFRAGTLNSVAKEHFRESLAHFFRRYSYNEWYPFTKEQFIAYKQKQNSDDIVPYEWQQ